jgi:hypothetical protein
MLKRTVGVVHRSDWLLLFLAAAPGTPLDPVRVQKGMFLLAMQASLGEDERYGFEPYAYGPMSRGLYGEVRRLCHERILEATPIEGATWRMLQLTPAGAGHAERVRQRAELEAHETLAQIAAIRREISGLSFSELLQHVYERYPEYAVRSVFRRSR